MWVEESLHCQYQDYNDRIAFTNVIMLDQVKNPCEQRLHYNIKTLKKRPSWYYLWHQWKNYLGAVNGQCWKCQSCSEYSQPFYIWLQLQKIASVDTILIESHILLYGRNSDVCCVWNSVSRSQIHPQQ